MSKYASRGKAADFEAAIDRIQLTLETLSWLAGWLILPAWLAARGVAVTPFLGYCLGAGLLLSLGVAADRSGHFRDTDHMIWFTGVSCLAILIIGGAVFALVSGVVWAVAQ